MKNVSMYTLSTCPWCFKTKKFFTERKIPFTYIDYDTVEEDMQKKIMREVDAAGATGFPYVNIGGEIIVGYQPQRYLNALGI
jgi:glutaredoxin